MNVESRGRDGARPSHSNSPFPVFVIFVCREGGVSCPVKRRNPKGAADRHTGRGKSRKPRRDGPAGYRRRAIRRAHRFSWSRVALSFTNERMVISTKFFEDPDDLPAPPKFRGHIRKVFGIIHKVESEKGLGSVPWRPPRHARSGERRSIGREIQPGGTRKSNGE